MKNENLIKIAKESLETCLIIKRAMVILGRFELAADLREIERKYHLKEHLETVKSNPTCSIKGHNMYQVFQKDNGRSVFGMHKCSLCGFTDEFQYDF